MKKKIKNNKYYNKYKNKQYKVLDSKELNNYEKLTILQLNFLNFLSDIYRTDLEKISIEIFGDM